MPEFLSWVLLHFAVAVAGTWLAIRYAVRRKLLDLPGERRSHAMATPRGGGIAIVAAVVLGIAWLAARQPEHAWPLASCALGLILVAGVGWADDHVPLPAWPRLLVQALAASMVAWAIHRTTAVMLDAVFAFALVMVMVNVWNFMDGIDGLAASQAAIAAAGLALALGAGPWAWVGGGLFAAIMGFLPFNFPKARIFLGDVGSGALGYLLALLILAAFASHRSQWSFLLLPVSVFLIDAGFTLVVRMLRRERWWEPHVQHAYQSWSRRLGSHGPVTMAYAVSSLFAVVLMLCALRWPQPLLNWVCWAWYGMLIVAWARLRRDVRLSKEASR
jgi:UDP-N-acetylmuramyl pentapeptide phosphotransferase/UDP-N-acetylglucosamine-1-phosphate transferase